MLIDEGMPSKAALVSLFTEFCRSFSYFWYHQDTIIPCMRNNV